MSETPTLEEAVEFAIDVLGFTPTYADFFIAVERGEIDGDVMTIEEGGDDDSR